LASTATFPDVALSLGNRIGRYFGLVSFLPAALLVFYAIALTEAKAWSDPPDIDLALKRLGDLSLADYGLALVLTLVISILLHPLQFPFTQMLEGYWGTSRVAAMAAATRIHRYRSQYWELNSEVKAAWVRLACAFGVLPPETKVTAVPAQARENIYGRLNSRAGDGFERVQDYWLLEQAEKRKQSLPLERARTMPTRLGNVLRRYEDLAGARYGLDAIAAVPRLAMIARPPEAAYLEDSRRAMDLAIRMCLVSTIATVMSIAALAPWEWWLLFALVPYAAAYCAYLGAVAAAHEYGAALCVLVDLSRFTLYDEMRLRRPSSVSEERRNNELLNRLWSSVIGRDEASAIPYADAQSRRR